MFSFIGTLYPSMKKYGLVFKEHQTPIAPVMHALTETARIVRHAGRIMIGWLNQNLNIEIGWMESPALMKEV